MIFTNILKKTIQIKIENFWLFLMIWLLIYLVIKRLNSIVIELFIRGRKLNICLVFMTQLYFKLTKDVRVYTTHFFITKIPNKKELEQFEYNHSSDVGFKNFMNL